MRDMVKPHSCKSSSASSELSMHKGSQAIPKLKPKIRIVHIYAPEIIKTDAGNFRELVQRLTGKPAEIKGNQERNQNFLLGNRNVTTAPSSKNIMSFDMETHCEFAGFQNGVRSIKEEDEEVWGNDNLSGFFDGFSDLDGFIEELSELPVH
ncbi:VQ motif-containing protein 25-like [Alnus glutinosa]|uniref:VQ motif-containing protein 25-like n=1 Tax=Alnus glutinosa TaxID=3517 RepID=UPI002D78A7DB|nr:VQ motif-containing protein 25-like [Alnus glutinosa]